MEAEIPLQSHRWLDIGTGSGLLASLAASFSCGSPVATEVYACEAVEEVVQVAAQTFKRNSKRNIQLFRCRSTELEVGDGQMPSRATHVVSELLGTGQFMSAEPIKTIPTVWAFGSYCKRGSSP